MIFLVDFKTGYSSTHMYSYMVTMDYLLAKLFDHIRFILNKGEYFLFDFKKGSLVVSLMFLCHLWYASNVGYLVQ